MHWMILPFKRYFEFSGRSRRKEFWMFQLLNALVSFAIFAIMLSGGGFQYFSSADPDSLADNSLSIALLVGAGLLGIWALAVLSPSIAVTVRRLHDRGISGWWYGGLLIESFIPILNVLAGFGMLALLVVMMLDGTDGPNKYGPDPKDPSQASVFE